MMIKRTKNLFPKAIVYCFITFLVILFIKEIVDEHKLKKYIEADPYYQSLYHAIDACKIVGNNSFEEIDPDKRHKVMMKCAEAYALMTLPGTCMPDDDPDFYKFLHGLKIIAQTHFLSEDVKRIDQSLEMIKDYLYKKQSESGYYDEDYNMDRSYY
jgi:hypothetical protein